MNDDRPCPSKAMGRFTCANQDQCWEPCGSLGKDPTHAKAVSKEGGDKINSALGINKGAQQEAVDLVQSYIDTLERRIEAAKNALENGNQTWLALEILNGKRGY